MKTKYLYSFLVVCYCFCASTELNAQKTPNNTESPPPSVDALISRMWQAKFRGWWSDKLLNSVFMKVPAYSNLFTQNADFARVVKDSTPVEVRYSRDSLDAPVDYAAEDSIVMDNHKKMVYLYGNAVIKYSTLQLKAAYIALDLDNNIATAEGRPDSVGRLRGNPEFKDADQNFTAKRMRYNFKTRKGMVYDVISKQKDVFIHGSQTKFVAAQRNSADSTKKGDDIAYSRDAIFTTCNAETPHFGIRSTRQKVIPNKLIVIGPSNLELGGVPSPVWLPFGFLPLPKNRSQGLIFPREYQTSPAWGFGLRDVGYFIPLSDTRNLRILSDIYFNGTFKIAAQSDYKKNYKNEGNFLLSYFREVGEDGKAEKVITPRYEFKWSHRQDQRAHPNFRFDASVDFQTGDFKRLVNNDFRSVNQAQSNSSINITKNFPNSPFTLSAFARAGQDFSTKKTTLELPNITLQMQQINPFRKKQRVGDERWYEKVVLRYNSEMRNRTEVYDSNFTARNIFNNAQFGVKHTASADAQIRIGYFNIVPSANYAEFWYLKTLQKQYDNTPITKDKITINPLTGDTIITKNGDTTALGTIYDAYKFGFQRIGQLQDIRVSLATASPIFGKLIFSEKGRIRAIRHTISGANVGFAYVPDYSHLIDSVEYRERSTYQRLYQRYNRYENTAIGSPSALQTSMGISYGFSNNFELKYFSKKDSIEKKIKLLDMINVSGFYNFLADSFKMQPLNVSTGTVLFKGLININVQSNFDFYKINENNVRINERLNTLLRFSYLNINATSSVSVSQIKSLFQKSRSTNPPPSVNAQPTGNRNNNGQGTQPNQEKTESLSDLGLKGLLDNFSFSYGFAYERRKTGNGIDTAIFTLKPLIINGNVPLNLQISKNWRITSSVSFDFETFRFRYPDIGFYRDLHCWEMGGNWQPERGTYSFFLRVKQGSFDFLKVPYNKNRVDAVRF